MAKKSVSQLAKELGVDRKELTPYLERIGKVKATARTALTDEEFDKIRELYLAAERPQVRIGEEKVVSTDAGVATERRTTANVIRRRRARDAGGTSEPAPGEGTGEEGLPPPLPAELLGGEELPPLPPEMPAEPPPPAPAEEPPAPAAEEETAEPEEQAPGVEEPAEEPEPEPLQAAPEEAPAAPPAEKPRPSESPAVAGPKVLGRIDLKKVEPQRPAAPAGVARGEPGARPAAPREDEGPARKKKKLKVIKKDPFEIERSYRPGRMPKKRRALPGKEQKKTEITVPKASKRLIRISDAITVSELSKQMGIKAGEVLKKLMDLGMMATINQTIDYETASLVASDFDFKIENVAFNAESVIEEAHVVEAADEAKQPRPPVVTIMGHVDHGKTSLLDAIRKTHVTAGEAGGITQHIGAYSVVWNGRKISFVDTPGHEAFTAMRARGAKVTDIVILVVAADDGVMPQTIEAINHARAAEVPIIVAVNKIDLPDADLERVKRGLADHGLVGDDWGGDTTIVPVSAKSQQGIPELLEMILLQADVLELAANPNKLARGIVVEAKLERGRGPVATVLVQEGTLKAGDPFVCGSLWGRVRAMMDENGQRLQEAGPSTPVELLGLQGVPEAGDVFTAMSDEATAKQVAGARSDKKRETQLTAQTKVSLEDLYQKIKTGEAKELRVIIKADVQGSVEALQEALGRLATDEVKIQVIHASVGGVSESDVLLASASSAIIIGFNIRPESKASKTAESEGVEIRLYSIIYEVLNDMRSALEGMLAPTLREKVLGRAEVRQPFSIPSIGTIAGSFVQEGKITRAARARLVRDNVPVWEGKIGSLRRFKDDVREVAAGYECGIGLENYNDVKPGDVIEAFEIEQIARRLESSPTRSSMAAERTA